MTLLVIWLLSSISLAADAVSYGAVTANGTYYGLNIGDSEYFDQEEKIFGNFRYGFGYTGVHLGNGLGITMSSSSGLALVGIKLSDDWISPLLGLEFGGRITANTSSNMASYYQWLPGVALGGQMYLTPRLQLTVLSKGGVGIGNWGRKDLLPDGSMYLGGAVYLNYREIGLGVEYVAFGRNYMTTVGVGSSYFGQTISINGSWVEGSGAKDITLLLLWRSN